MTFCNISHTMFVRSIIFICLGGKEMRLFKRNNVIRDERMENMANKVYKEAYFVAMAVCLVSLIIKAGIYGKNIWFVLPEILILLVPAVYYGIRTALLGLYIDEVELHDRNNKLSLGTKNIIIGLILGLAFALFFGIRSALLYGTGIAMRAWYFILVFAVSLMMYAPFFILYLVSADAAARKAGKRTVEKDEE